jgi:Ca2+-binding RTX toxin-like protein
VAPVIPTSSTTINVNANVGQTVTLPPVSFTQDGLNDVHTATANWDDGTGVDTSPQVTEEASDGTTVTLGSIAASHVFSTANTYSVSLTVTDDAGLSATQNFSVNVTGATVTLGTFTPSTDGSQFQLSYTVAIAAAAPFNIDIDTSPDGTTPGQLLMSIPIDGTTYPLNEGFHTISFTPSFTDPQQDYHLIAVSDGDGSQSTVEFAGGAFYATDPTVSSAAAYVYAYGSPAGSTSIDVGTSTITVGGVSYPIPANATAIHVRAENPGNTITVDPSMTLQTWLYGDTIQDTLTVTPDNNVPLTNLVIDNFSVDSNGLPAVTFTNDGEDAPPFSIGIFNSSDGVTPTTLVGTIDVGDSDDLTGGGVTHTLEYTGDLGALNGSQNYFIAQLDCYDQVTETSKSDNTSAPLSGAYQNSDGSVDVLGTGTSGTISLANGPNSGDVVVSGVGSMTTFNGVTSVYVASYGGTDTVDGSGLNVPMMVYGGSGSDTIMGGAVSNWIQAGSGGATIYGGSGNDWLYGGAGTNMIYGGSGTEMIYGGSGNNTLVGGTGLDDIYGGSGTNWIYGNGQNDRLWGGSGNNYIDPRGGTGLATVEVEDHNGLPTFDGNIDASGNSDNGDYEAIADPGYGGQVANWDFSGFDSGVRLGEDATTPMAVYANWQSTASPSPGTQWVDNAVYVVMDGSTILGTVTVDQTSSPGNGSPESADRPWKLLGVWNVPAGDTIEVILKSGDIGSANPGDMLCAGDVMVHAIWPTVTIRTNANGDGNLDTKDDWVDSFQPIQMAVEGTGTRTELQLQTSIEMLYFSISSAIATEALPSVSGLTFWSSEQTTTPLTPDSNGNIIDQSLSSSDYTNTSTLYCSFPANSNDSSVQIQLAFQSASGKALSVLRGANNAQRNDFYVSLFKSPAKRNPDGSSELIVKSPTINPSLMGGNAVDTSAQYQLHFAAGRPNEAVQTVTCTGSLTLNLVVPNGAAAAPPMTLTLAWNEVYAEMWTTS